MGGGVGVAICVEEWWRSGLREEWLWSCLEALEDGDFDDILVVLLYLSSTRRGLLVELLQEVWGIEVMMINPAVVRGWVSFPVD